MLTSVEQIPEFVWAIDGKQIRLNPGEITVIFQLCRCLPINEILRLHGIDRYQMRLYLSEYTESLKTKVRSLLSQSWFWRMDDSPVDFTDSIIGPKGLRRDFIMKDLKKKYHMSDEDMEDIIEWFEGTRTEVKNTLERE